MSWPKFNELQSSAILVLVASLIFAIVIGFVDLVLRMLWPGSIKNFNIRHTNGQS